MAVPAPFTLNTFELELKASTITCVSSQSERFSTGFVFKLSAFRMRTLLLMLLDAGSSMVAFNSPGGYILYCMLCRYFDAKIIINYGVPKQWVVFRII
jgi:hypothetical protein